LGLVSSFNSSLGFDLTEEVLEGAGAEPGIGFFSKGFTFRAGTKFGILHWHF